MVITEVAATRYGDGGDFEIVVVQVRTDDGLCGLGYQMLFGVSGEFTSGLIEQKLAPAVDGLSPWLTAQAWQRMVAVLPRRGSDGLARGAIGAVDMALWDLKGLAAGVPVAHLLGGARERIPTYINCAHHLEPGALAKKASSYVAAGHRALKIRGSRTFVTPDMAFARVQAVREAIGPDIKLMVDVNGTWDSDTAIRQLKRWEPYDVYWLEEPVPPQDITGYGRISARSGSTNIVGGEQNIGLAEFQALIEQGGVDIVQPNAAVTGGITDWLHIHAFATAQSVPVSPWNMQAVHMHMASGLPNVLWIEYFLPENPLLMFKSRLFAGPELREIVCDEGVFLEAPAAPGLGLVLDEAVSKRSRIVA